LGLRLQSRALVRAVDAGAIDGLRYIAMEYVPGQDLRALIDHAYQLRQTLPLPLILHVAVGICDGLAAIHAALDEQGRPFVHRGAAPPTGPPSAGGGAQLFARGAALPAGATLDSGPVYGKWCYASPEHIHGRAIDARSDLFSAGAVLHEMLTLQRLYQ